LETIQRDPNALQNYLQSQRANPSLATRGENVLDRFLTQSTESGQKAIAGLGTTAGAIRGSQAPSIIGDIETLRTQAQSEPLRAGEIQNLITSTTKPEEDFVKGINNLYIASKIGIGNRIDPIKASATPNKTINPATGREEIVFSFEQLPKLTYQKPQATTQATEQDINKAKKQFNANVKPMFNVFENWFGAYPFYRDGYKLIETPYLGMEHQSAVAYGNKYLKGYMGRDLSGTGLGLKWDYIIIHETGHEWFGNNITAKDIADMWIHEGFTMYSEALYVESRDGKDAGAFYIFKKDAFYKKNTIALKQFNWAKHFMLNCQDINTPEDLEEAKRKYAL
jgi:hypothetical protein